MTTIDRRQHDASSLGSLSRRFIELVESRVDGVVELNETAKLLNARKRRVYDITNVLEGVGLLEKISKNKVKWTPQTEREMEMKECKAESLQREIMIIEENLRKMEMGIQEAFADVRCLNADAVKRHLFLRKSDIVGLQEMNERRCFAVKFSDEAQLCKKSIPSSNIHRLIASCANGDVQVIELTDKHESARHSQPMDVDDASKENHT